MNIVIVGAGNTGQYLATLLSKEHHNVTVIDNDKTKLETMAQTTDVATRYGSGTDWQLLDDILEIQPDLLIALTQDDNCNLVVCALAKQLGYPTTIARVHDTRFLNRTRLDFGRVFDVDYFICPEMISANEILKYIVNEGSIAVEYFAHGAMKLRILKIPADWKLANVPLGELHLPDGVMIGLIYRKSETIKEGIVIFPHGQDVLLPNDEVTLIGEIEPIHDIHKFFGIKIKEVHSVVIAGGSQTAFHLAKLLEKRHFGIRIIEKDLQRATFLAENLPNTTIIHNDALNIEFLAAEKINQADLVIAATRSDETNLFFSILAKEVGCEEVLMLLSNSANLPVLNKLGIAHAVSPTVSASNRIMAHVFTTNVNTLISLYDNRAKVVEIIVSMDSKVVGIPISELGPMLPKDFLIAMIQNRGRIMIAHGNRIISPGDTVIVITDPKHISELEKIF